MSAVGWVSGAYLCVQEAAEFWPAAQILSYRRDDQRVNREKMIKEECRNYDTEVLPQRALEKKGRKCSLKPHCLFFSAK